MAKTKGVKNINHGRVEFRHMDKHHIIEQRLDGLHVRIRYGREEPRIIPFSQIVADTAPTIAKAAHANLNGSGKVLDFSTFKAVESFADDLDCLAEDLKLVVAAIKDQSLTATHINESSEQARKAFKLLRGVTAANLQQLKALHRWIVAKKL
jgi:hypothetical protein